MKSLFFIFCLFFSFLSNAKEIHEVSFGGEKGSFIEYSGEYEPVFGFKSEQYIEVLYFFNYNCPSCFKMYPYINFWEKNVMNKNIRFERIPVSLTSDWTFASKLYFLRSIMGFNLKLDSEIYKLINYKTIKINSDEDIITFFTKYNFATEEEIKKELTSNKIKYSMERSKQIVNDLGIKGTPRIIITKNKKRYEINLENNKKPISIIVALNEIINPEK